MEILDTKSLKGGWFIGNFDPTLYKTEACEVAYKYHFPGEDWPEHYHQHSDEINYLVSGQMEINGQKIEAPRVFIIKKGEAAKPRFITTVSLIVVRVPGIPNDKVLVDTTSDTISRDNLDSIVMNAAEQLKSLLIPTVVARKRKVAVGKWERID